MKTKFVCGKCGFQSEDRECVLLCEDQTRKALYTYGQVVRVECVIRETRVILTGTVIDSFFKTRTHAVFYQIQFDGIYEIPEEDIIGVIEE